MAYRFLSIGSLSGTRKKKEFYPWFPIVRFLLKAYLFLQISIADACILWRKHKFLVGRCIVRRKVLYKQETPRGQHRRVTTQMPYALVLALLCVSFGGLSVLDRTKCALIDLKHGTNFHLSAVSESRSMLIHADG